MQLRKTCLLTVVGTLIAAGAYADVIPFFGTANKKRSSKMYSHLEMTTRQLPPGMVLLLLDSRDSLVVLGHEKERLFIFEPVNVYLAREDQLSTPFSYRKDQKKLNKLKSITSGDLPWRNFVQPKPELLDCTLAQDRPDKFRLVCTSSIKED